ncbi:MAG: FAD-dependent oxidoreductase [Solirubrobacterales bacterium]|nr:FAD-dependent oxidoreductase [Solirubrobacterales bacterium]
MTAVDRVLIVGGGIAGTSLAIELGRQGIEAEIVEREPVWGATGTGITLMGPALRALKTLGVLEQCLPDGYGVDEMKAFTADGEFLEAVPLAGLLGAGYPAISGMMRPDLHRVLSQTALSEGASVRVGVTVAALDRTDDNVDVRFTDGTRGSYDLVVGADGCHSAVRRMMLGDAAPEPRFLGQVVWRALVERPAEVTGLWMFYGSRHKTGFTPLTPERMYVFLVEPAQDRTRPAPAERPGLMRELLAEFGGVMAEVRETIRDPDQVDVRALEALLLEPPWYRGRVVLIGDAAHATTPQLAMGGAIALEDAIVLAALLGSETTVEETLSKFMDRRYERSRLVVENSVQLAEWEKNAAAHGEDSAQLMGESYAALAAPI